MIFACMSYFTIFSGVDSLVTTYNYIQPVPFERSNSENIFCRYIHEHKMSNATFSLITTNDYFLITYQLSVEPVYLNWTLFITALNIHYIISVALVS